MSAISYYHRQAKCLLLPTHHPLVRETFKAIRREIGTRQRTKQALLTEDVRKIVECCPDTLACKRDKASLSKMRFHVRAIAGHLGPVLQARIGVSVPTVQELTRDVICWMVA